MPVISDLRVIDRRHGNTEIHLDGQPWLTVAPETVVTFHLRKELPLEEALKEEIRLFDERLRARQSLARYTALAMKSSGQGRLYLLRRGIGEEAIEEAIAYGKERGWIDDARYAVAYVRQSNKLRPRGPRKLASELVSKGIDPNVAAEALVQAGPNDEEQHKAAERIVHKRAAALARRFDGVELRRKLMDHLLSQGYEIDLARQVVDQALADMPPLNIRRLPD